jgi:uncharacterized protein YqeY
MSLLERVTGEIAMPCAGKIRRRWRRWRMLKAALMNKEVEKSRALDEAESLQVVNALVKQRRDSAEQFRAGQPDRSGRQGAE